MLETRFVKPQASYFSEVTASMLLDPFSPPGLLGTGSGDFSDPGDNSENFVLQAQTILLPPLIKPLK